MCACGLAADGSVHLHEQPKLEDALSKEEADDPSGDIPKQYLLKGDQCPEPCLEVWHKGKRRARVCLRLRSTWQVKTQELPCYGVQVPTSIMLNNGGILAPLRVGHAPLARQTEGAMTLAMAAILTPGLVEAIDLLLVERGWDLERY